jgi:hypothetical protein
MIQAEHAEEASIPLGQPFAEEGRRKEENLAEVVTQEMMGEEFRRDHLERGAKRGYIFVLCAEDYFHGIQRWIRE